MSVSSSGPLAQRPKFSGARRLIVAAFTVAALIAGAIFVRLWNVPAEDALHGDGDEAVGAVASAIGKLPDAEKTAQLRRYLEDPAPGLRQAAIEHIAERHDPATADVFEKAFMDSSSIVRQRAVENLMDISPERGLRVIAAGLKDSDVWIRHAAIGQLRTRVTGKTPLKDKRLVPALIPALNDADPVVQGGAISALAKLTGQTWHYRNAAPDAERETILNQARQWWAKEKAAWPASAELADIPAVVPTRTDPAPDFSLTDIDGKSLTLTGRRGKVTLLNFWGTWCPPCQQEIPDLVRLDKDYRDKGVDIVGIALSEDSADSLRKWCQSHHIAYRQVMAVESLQHAYGDIHEVPISVLIDGQGRIVERWEGERDYATFAAAVERALKSSR